MTLAALIEDLRQRAGEDGSFVGGTNHLAALSSYAEEVEPDAVIRWSDDRTYFEPKTTTIVLERPAVGVEPELSIRLITANLVHELAHLRYTDRPALSAFLNAPFILKSLEGATWAFDLYNQLEDARLLRIVNAVDTEAAALLREMHSWAVEAACREYSAAHSGESAWSAEPAAEAWQAMIALTELILVGDRPPVTERVKRLLDEASPHVDAARNGAAAEVRSATIKIYQLVGAANLSQQ